MDRVKMSSWSPYLSESLGHPSQWVKGSGTYNNPYYKSFTNSYITTINLWPSATTGKLNQYYNMTENIPIRLKGDFTLVINPFKRSLLKVDGTVLTHLQINLITAVAPNTKSLKIGDEPTRWNHGMNIFDCFDNAVTGESISSEVSRIVIDLDDTEQRTEQTPISFFGASNNDNSELAKSSNIGFADGAASTGVFRTSQLRFAVGVGNISSATVQADQKFEILLIPHKARGNFTS
tara:strand:- start:7362 stop:8066 length:705 start_codon:yes stop_codon:yes gene_type:complete